MTKNPTIETGESVACFGENCMQKEKDVVKLLNSSHETLENTLGISVNINNIETIRKTLKWVLKK